ncbi:RsmB/NOP family class I SAM-dependent RNA methyltransferase [Acidocella sp. KAb 2-4]|uniref:RsmB/NOP family class I SAM-dependent RNA methyltransferase n=1 Tax=Acidocella sp. KAb 2-4 TaxID=2885158 RepID=UPI001D08CF62|nr:RsmB/NOP family class I SAM-dependent RNA methyltransferase [Acidocella sp. KAb 2-4]MCB5945345.1 RsmB/NOP family class I SAM-dependent RNA methyltransferase [Acidocella sp. KAb 2-4]
MTPAGQLAAAIDLLAEIEADPRPADAVANHFFRNRRFIGGGDRRAVSALVWGVLRARRHLGWWLERLGAPVTPRLLLAAQAVLAGQSPHKVAIAFTAGRYGPPPLAPEEAAILDKFVGHTLEHPAMPEAVKYEIPDWILPKLKAQFGPALAAEMAAMNEPAPLDLRVNMLKSTREAALTALAREALQAEPTAYSPWGLRLKNRQSVTQGKAFQDGLVEIQDEGSQLIALAVDAQPGMRVVDYCAGAGGKTLAIAMTMQNKGHIVACDVSAPRLDGAIKRLRRAGVHNAERHLLEPGDKWLKRQGQKFDRVLVDAPCSGTGTWRRNPDARTRLSETDLAELTQKQAMILDQAQKLVKPGGKLVYATCSVLNDENEAQVEAFLARYPIFEQMPIEAPAALRGPALRLSPRVHGTDGFFAAVLRRRET